MDGWKDASAGVYGEPGVEDAGDAGDAVSAVAVPLEFLRDAAMRAAGETEDTEEDEDGNMDRRKSDDWGKVRVSDANTTKREGK
jgi:hypothetical protein